MRSSGRLPDHAGFLLRRTSQQYDEPTAHLNSGASVALPPIDGDKPPFPYRAFLLDVADDSSAVGFLASVDYDPSQGSHLPFANALVMGAHQGWLLVRDFRTPPVR